MNDELNELFDIKKDEIKEKNHLPKPRQNILVHSIVRIVILIITTVLTCGILFLAVYDSRVELLFLGAFITLVWLGVMIFETIKLNKKNYKDLAISNMVLIFVEILIILVIITQIAY